MLRKRQSDGHIVEAMLSKPSLYEDLLFVWNCFAKLDQHRQRGFGPSPVAVCDFLALMQIHGVTDQEELEEMLDHISSMDQLALRHYWSKRGDGNRSSREGNDLSGV